MFPNSPPTKSKKDSIESSEKGCWLHVPTYNSHNTMWIQKRRCYWPAWYSIFCCAHQSISAKALWEQGGCPCGIVSLWQPEPVVSCISVGDKGVGDTGDKEVEVAGIEEVGDKEVGDTSRILHAEEMQEAVLLQKTKHKNCQQFCTSFLHQTINKKMSTKINLKRKTKMLDSHWKDLLYLLLFCFSAYFFVCYKIFKI